MTNNIVRKLHIVALLLLAMPLIGAYGIQLLMHEMPCPLCLLQRVGMLAVAVGLLMNLRFGVHPVHYGLTIIAALVGAAVATRQVLLHIVPTADGITGFGDTVLGLHLYSWSVVVFLASILGVGLLMALMKWGKNFESEDIILNTMEKGVFFLFIFIGLANVAGAFLECGLMPCPDNPITYKYW